MIALQWKPNSNVDSHFNGRLSVLKPRSVFQQLSLLLDEKPAQCNTKYKVLSYIEKRSSSVVRSFQTLALQIRIIFVSMLVSYRYQISEFAVESGDDRYKRRTKASVGRRQYVSLERMYWFTKLHDVTVQKRATVVFIPSFTKICFCNAAIFWDIAQRSAYMNRLFRRTYHFHSA
jgi:hypothetical protein